MKSISYMLLISLNLWGCLITEFEDVSSEPEFTDLIGVEMTSNIPLIAYGVTMEPKYEKILDHYVITTLPGIGGPEIISETTLPKGTKFKIIKVMRCIYCLKKQKDLEVEVIEGPKLDGAPSRFDYDNFIQNTIKIFTIMGT